MDDSEPSSSGRSRRQKPDKSGRFAALEKFKQLKGNKHKYEVSELENVYDEVDENAYSKTVMERQNDDWIVDDGGSGYVEDGREIFDDDLDDDSIEQAAKNTSLAGPRKKKKLEPKSKGNIKNMFLNMSSKKKPEEKVTDDNILGDLMSELQKTPSTPKRKPTQVRNVFHVAQKTQPAKPVSSTRPIVDENKKKDRSLPKDSEDEDRIFEVATHSDTVSDDGNESTSVKTTKASESRMKIPDGNRVRARVEDKKKDNGTASVGDESKQLETTGADEMNMEISDADLMGLEFDDVDFDEDAKSASSKPSENSNNTGLQSKEPSTKPSEKINCGTKSKNAISNDTEIDFGDQVWADDFETEFTEAEIGESTDVKLDSIPLVTNAAGEKVFRFFWWDAYEDQYKQPGTVYMFGKVYIEATKSYTSCCLQIKNIPRRLYLLPREHMNPKPKNSEEPVKVEIDDVYKEFNDWATRRQITEFKSMKVKKKYAFDRENTPRESDYLEVRYSASLPAMTTDYSGPAIEHVFGSTVSSLEFLLMERNIKGPCWLEVKNALPAGNPTSWCSLQVNCIKHENISVYVPDDASPKLPITPMIVATVNIRVALNSKHQENEIVMIGILIQDKYHIDKAPPKPMFQRHYCLVTRPRDTTWPLHARDMLSKTKLIKCETEIDLLEQFLDIIQKADPDLLVGNDLGFQFDVLIHRISTLKIRNWSRVGKLRRNLIPSMKGRLLVGQSFSGRLICDIQASAKELNLKVRSFDLQSLCMAILKMKENECREIKPTDCPVFYSSAKKIENLVQITMNEASYVMTLMFELNVIPLAVQITSITGYVLSRTLTAGRAERIEYLLLHAFDKRGYITPDKRFASKGKEEGQANTGKKKAAYTGGLVLDPKKGFYEKLILLMDFNSLYPSIIQEYNLCFTTVPGAAYADVADLQIPVDNLVPGVVPTEIRKLVESRGEVKKLMKTPNLSPELKMQYNIRQLALKLTANSMYGCLGSSYCRFYAKGLAALVTAKGREILINTKSLVEKLNYDVIYGDTDSIMINTNNLNYDEAFAIAKKIKQEVNKLYKKIELDIDGVFKYLLLLQKKKYAAVLMNKTPSGEIELVMEHKGLDIVRRDWCQIACDTGKNILDQLLFDQPSDTRLEKVYEILENVGKSIRDGQLPLSSLVLTKRLSKNPKDYPERKLPHVSIAMRLNKEGGRMWKAGDTVPYIICEDGTTRSATERAYHVDEFKKSDTLKIDVNYYLMSQITPVVMRLCDPIEGFDEMLLVKCLGLEDIYKSKRPTTEQRDAEFQVHEAEERFKYCLPLKFKCRNNNCNEEIEIKEFFATLPSGKLPALAKCPNAECDMPPYKYVNAIQNDVQLAVRKAIKEYYAETMECEDPVCTNTTRYLPMIMNGHLPACSECKESFMHRIYTESKLYTQLSFYLHIFDLNQAMKTEQQSSNPPEMISAYDLLKEFVEKQLTRNAYSVVDLSSIFSSSGPEKLENTNVNEDEVDELIFENSYY